MDFLKNAAYRQMLRTLLDDFPCWEALEGKRILISGASGMIGSLLIDALMLRNIDLDLSRRTRILAVSRSEATARRRFSGWFDYKEFLFFFP